MVTGGRYVDKEKLNEFLEEKYQEIEVEHEENVNKRFDTYTEKLKKVLEKKQGEDLTLEDFIEIEKLYHKKFRTFALEMRETGLDAFIGGDTRKESRERKGKIKKFAKDEDAFSFGLAASIFGVVATLIQAIKYLRNKFVYIPLWKRGKDDIQKSYRFSEKRHIYTNFMKYMNGRPTGLSDFGLLFGISRKEYVNICAVIPLDELIVGAKTLRDYEEANLLRTLLDEIRDDIRANGCNQTCPVKLQGLTRLMFEKMNTRELIKKVKKRGLGKTYFKSNNPELRFLGVYYYNKDLLTHDYEMDKIIDNFAEEKQEQLHDIRQKILKKVEAVKKHLESKETSFSPKFLFFEKQTQFKKIDNIMKGLIPFFQARSGKIGKFHGLPIIVCMDDIGQTKRWMCLGYRKSEGIYKRLRYYSKK